MWENVLLLALLVELLCEFQNYALLANLKKPSFMWLLHISLINVI